jgi:hypothetical protein
MPCSREGSKGAVLHTASRCKAAGKNIFWEYEVFTSITHHFSRGLLKKNMQDAVSGYLFVFVLHQKLFQPEFSPEKRR